MKQNRKSLRLRNVFGLATACLTVIMTVGTAQAAKVSYTLDGVFLADGTQITGAFDWTYEIGDFEGGSGIFTALEIPWTIYSFGDGNLDIIIESKQIEITGNGNYHDVGLDIKLVLSPPLSLTQSSPIDLGLSFFECCGNGFKDQPFISGSISPVVDADGDGVPDSTDNCPVIANPGQEDADNDGMGNACDSDDDNDGLDDSYELSIGTNPLLVDTDSDGFGDGLEDANGSNPLSTTSTPANGDINENGTVDAGDFLLATRIVTGLLTPNPQQVLRGDIFPVGGGIPVPDGNITLSDLILIQRKVLGLIP